ncbi:MAG: hypothetical protein RL322_226 [Pseudomonadota bacterium]
MSHPLFAQASTRKGRPQWDQLVGQAARLGRMLSQRSATIVTAESCTGGLVAALLTENPGSSLWFDRGFVTYSNAAKIELLGVRPLTLERYGAVSEPVVREMALGALAVSEADLAVSVSGVAGPGGGSADKPVGLVCLAWAARGRLERAGFGSGPAAVTAVTVRFPGDRQGVRFLSARLALSVAWEQCLESGEKT